MTVAEISTLIDKIHSTGYWRINIRPTVFQPTRISQVSECKDFIANAKVSLRGWDYPHIDPRNLIIGQDWIENSTDWQLSVEYWRFFQSAQFVHHFSCSEDYEHPNHKVLGMLNTLYTATEIFLFASRLGVKNLLSPAAEITIELMGMEGRQIYEPSRVFSGQLISRIDQIKFQRIVDVESLIAQSSEIAIDATTFIFERFNWEHPSRQVLIEDQRRLLERRL
jgi:hypothetical protein